MNPKDQNEPFCQSSLSLFTLKLYVSKTVANLLYPTTCQGPVDKSEYPFLPLSLSILSAGRPLIGETSTQIIVHMADI